MKHAELAARLDAAADRLTTRVLREMYANPFWHERFGDRADRHGKQDGRFHIDYLIQAVQAGDDAIMHNYARWLQPVLTSRGMCSRHLAENFERLGDAIRDERWPHGDIAIELLDVARSALEYSGGPQQALQRGAARLASAAADALYTRHPEWQAKWGDAGRARCVDDLDYHIQYLADAIALAQPAVFATYVVWIAGFLERRHIPRSHVIESLRALRAAAATTVPEAADELAAIVETALAALAKE